MIIRAVCILVGFMLGSIAIGYTDRWFALPLVAIGTTLMIWGVQP